MSVRDGQARLKRLSDYIDSITLPDEAEKDFIVRALRQIAAGENSEIVLQVKAKRGERKSQAMADAELRRKLALAWMAVAIAPVNEGGLGLSVQKAAAKIKMELSHLPSEDSLKRTWSDYKRKGGGPVFKL